MEEYNHITYEDRKFMELHREDDFTIKDIAALMEKSFHLVKNEYGKGGGRRNYTADQAEKLKDERDQNRKLSHTFRKAESKKVDLEVRKKIESYKDTNLSGSSIGRRVGRHKNVVNREFKLFPDRTLYNAEMAQNMADQAKENLYKKLRKPMNINNINIEYAHPVDNIDINQFIMSRKKQEISINSPSYIPRLPLKVWVDRYKEEKAPFRKYWRKEIRYFNFWLLNLGDKIAVDISPKEIECIADSLLEKESPKNKGKHMSAETRRKYLLHLSSLYTVASKEWKWCVVNPFSAICLTKNKKNTYDTSSLDKVELNDMVIKFINSRISEIKDENKINLIDMCKKAGISRSVFSRVLSGSENVTLKTICRICDSLNIDLFNIS